MIEAFHFQTIFRFKESSILYSKFSKFKEFVSGSVFEELQLTQISTDFKTSCCNLKIRGLGVKTCLAFLYFNFERNYDLLKSKNPCFLLNKNVTFNKNETKSKMELITRQLIRITKESCDEWKLVIEKREQFFNVYFVGRKFF